MRPLSRNACRSAGRHGRERVQARTARRASEPKAAAVSLATRQDADEHPERGEPGRKGLNRPMRRLAPRLRAGLLSGLPTMRPQPETRPLPRIGCDSASLGGPILSHIRPAPQTRGSPLTPLLFHLL
jgi:hypothetical protein